VTPEFTRAVEEQEFMQSKARSSNARRDVTVIETINKGGFAVLVEDSDR
jgi:hypothetical protein